MFAFEVHRSVHKRDRRRFKYFKYFDHLGRHQRLVMCEKHEKHSEGEEEIRFIFYTILHKASKKKHSDADHCFYSQKTI